MLVLNESQIIRALKGFNTLLERESAIFGLTPASLMVVNDCGVIVEDDGTRTRRVTHLLIGFKVAPRGIREHEGVYPTETRVRFVYPVEGSKLSEAERDWIGVFDEVVYRKGFYKNKAFFNFTDLLEVEGKSFVEATLAGANEFFPNYPVGLVLYNKRLDGAIPEGFSILAGGDGALYVEYK